VGVSRLTEIANGKLLIKNETFEQSEIGLTEKIEDLIAEKIGVTEEENLKKE
jgi:hypothetical protein